MVNDHSRVQPETVSMNSSAGGKHLGFKRPLNWLVD